MSNRMVERPDRIAVAATVSIPEGMTVAEVNAAADAASAARAAQRDEEER